MHEQLMQLAGFEVAVDRTLARLQVERFGVRLHERDATLWKQDPAEMRSIEEGLGWLDVVEKMLPNVQHLDDFRTELRQAGIRHVVHMGMGGSSLAPLVFQRSIGATPEGLPLTVLDTTDPATVLSIEGRCPVEQTLFIVATKSGTTVEPTEFMNYFYERLRRVKGDRAGENMVAITDPNTRLVHVAQERGFRKVFINMADIGGRYSALSYFGLLPAALLGIDVETLLNRTMEMVQACGPGIPVADNPGVRLGVAIGQLALLGRDKVTFLVPEALRTLGLWLEQLIAESTGKEGKGILPVAGEAIGDPRLYGEDRVFVHIGIRGVADVGLDALRALSDAGHPVISIQIEDLLDLGKEFYRWEVATATVGAILEINPFDQPNVQESKDNTDHLLALVRAEGQLPAQDPAITAIPLRIYGDQDASTVCDALVAFFGLARQGDYVSLLAYLKEEPAIEDTLERIRLLIRDNLRLATTTGYGPRYLHSTGQLHKGGPDTGLFLEFTADDPVDVPIPGQPYSFSLLKRAQALGDLAALRRHGRRVMRIDLGRDAERGLLAVEEEVKKAFAHCGPC